MTQSRYEVPKPVEHPWLDPDDVPVLRNPEADRQEEDAGDLPIFGTY